MKRKTNEQLLKQLMTQSRYGAVSQMFILQALLTFSRDVVARQDELEGNLIVHREAWIGVATEIKTAIEAHLEIA